MFSQKWHPKQGISICSNISSSPHIPQGDASISEDLYTFDDLDELYKTAEQLPEVSRHDVYAHHEERDEWTQVSYKDSLWTDDGRATGVVSSNNDFYNIIQYGDILRNIGKSIERHLDAQEITDEVKIRLEYEERYDWICFVPMRNSEAGALTKYFGKKTGTDDYKIRGIEIRQRSTPRYVEDRQRKYLDVLDQHRTPEAVLNQLQRDLRRLRNGDVPSQELVVKNKASKPLEAYSPETLVVSALHRYKKHGIEKSPGQDVQYIVVDNQARLKDRVRLPFETVESYDTDHYSKLLIRAAESIVSPLGWKQADINQYLRETNDTTIWAYE